MGPVRRPPECLSSPGAAWKRTPKRSSRWARSSGRSRPRTRPSAREHHNAAPAARRSFALGTSPGGSRRCLGSSGIPPHITPEDTQVRFRPDFGVPARASTRLGLSGRALPSRYGAGVKVVTTENAQFDRFTILPGSAFPDMTRWQRAVASLPPRSALVVLPRAGGPRREALRAIAALVTTNGRHV